MNGSVVDPSVGDIFTEIMTRDTTQSTRRTFLGSAALAFLGGLAGCLNDQNRESQDPPASPTMTTSTSNGTQSSTTTSQTTPVVKTPQPTPTSNSTSTPEPASSKPLSPPLVSVSGTTKYGIELTGSPVIGKKNTDPPIDIYYWYDYQCRYCQQFELSKYGALAPLVHNEISNGTVRMILLDYPNYGGRGSHSWTAAIMAKCIWRDVKDRNPDLFWKWHHTVFKHQGLVDGEWSSRKSLLGYARNITGIDARAVETCLRQNRKQIRADVQHERKRARKIGFKGTPSFVLYNPKTGQHSSLYGAQPYPVFQRTIQTLLGK
jgi:protein-disulfide isomerase